MKASKPYKIEPTTYQPLTLNFSPPSSGFKLLDHPSHLKTGKGDPEVKELPELRKYVGIYRNYMGIVYGYSGFRMCLDPKLFRIIAF